MDPTSKINKIITILIYELVLKFHKPKRVSSRLFERNALETIACRFVQNIVKYEMLL